MPFTEADLIFGDEAGDFRTPSAAGRAHVVGNGLRGFWTLRALEKEGFGLVAGLRQGDPNPTDRCDDGG